MLTLERVKYPVKALVVGFMIHDSVGLPSKNPLLLSICATCYEGGGDIIVVTAVGVVSL